MFIVSKVDIIENSIDIVKVVNDNLDYEKLVAYDAMIQDALKCNSYSVKNINENRIEIYIKGLLGSYLKYIYTLHEIDEDKTEEEINEDKTEEEIN